ncbi:hypothetical protein KJ765_03050 [Candidatus Micrarchaeota archaeon]|nr:hypothetical protein [Candidatus Micrarchaeota archaeon]
MKNHGLRLLLFLAVLFLPATALQETFYTEEFTDELYKDILETNASWDTAPPGVLTLPLIPSLENLAWADRFYRHCVSIPLVVKGQALYYLPRGSVNSCLPPSDRMIVYGLSDPKNPVYEREFQLDGMVTAYDYDDNYLFLSEKLAGDQRLSIWDISDPLNPVLVGSHFRGGHSSLVVVGDRLYATLGTSFFIYDVSTPAVPTEIFSNTLPGISNTAKILEKQGNFLYVAEYIISPSDVRMHVLDVSLINNYQVRGNILIDGGVEAEWLDGFLWVADDSFTAPKLAKFYVLDVSDPNAPSIRRIIPSPEFPADCVENEWPGTIIFLQIEDHTGYLTCFSSTRNPNPLYVLDLTNIDGISSLGEKWFGSVGSVAYFAYGFDVFSETGYTSYSVGGPQFPNRGVLIDLSKTRYADLARGQSLDLGGAVLDDGRKIKRAKLTKVDALDPLTSVSYFLNYGLGNAWSSVIPGVWYNVNPRSALVRWRSELRTSDGSMRPVVDSIRTTVESCGCEVDADCSGDAWQCMPSNIFERRTFGCPDACECSFGDWAPGTCWESVQICGAECNDDFDCNLPCSGGQTYQGFSCDANPTSCSCVPGVYECVIGSCGAACEDDSDCLNPGDVCNPFSCSCGPNEPPIVDAGSGYAADVFGTISLAGTASDTGDIIEQAEWSLISNPPCTLNDMAYEGIGTDLVTATALLSCTEVGVYTVQLWATDDEGAEGQDQAIVIVALGDGNDGNNGPQDPNYSQPPSNLLLLDCPRLTASDLTNVVVQCLKNGVACSNSDILMTGSPNSFISQEKNALTYSVETELAGDYQLRAETSFGSATCSIQRPNAVAGSVPDFSVFLIPFFLSAALYLYRKRG